MSRAQDLQQQYINQQEYKAKLPAKKELFWYKRSRQHIIRVFYADYLQTGFKVTPFPIQDYLFIKVHAK